ncbi:RNA cap guanine-N2 methyltransferase [Polaribacter sp. Hel1_33_78]|uniref:class I SAM-dependent methyltransferase n=1 Tax=Polaribacter sp. Hel1_33_78 TaxID=1336804 RepID=UPI00087B7383|nr:class I SAM-dependent methyltransferase [Polaribacter sp. Hel1_33_78]SDT98899.1 RNA cap guanine-N2 methyltransferase [Polaribacter sp. Hel1_33_78]
MNTAILHPKVQQFIANNLKSNITKLILKGSPFDLISIQELANQIIAKQKSEQKLPTWFSAKNIYYPPKLSIEQTSSEITADYKSKFISGNAIIDITGGFGVDCCYFSKQFKKVIHCEINEDLSTIVKHNYQQLNIKNIQTVCDDGITFLKNTDTTFDCIYIDPSRRNEVKGKVFLLKDCLPNVPENIDFLFTKTAQILLKNSPILDISSVISELNFVKEVHIIALQNEVKEVLFLLEKNYKEEIQIKTINIRKEDFQRFDFKLKETVTSNYSAPLSYLYEPNAAILKSGAFHQVSKQLNVFKVHQHSHLYTSNEIIDFPGRVFKVENVIPYHKKKIKNFLSDDQANITIRNFPKTVNQIRKETKIKDGGNSYLFFTTLKNNKLVVICCKKTGWRAEQKNIILLRLRPQKRSPK